MEKATTIGEKRTRACVGACVGAWVARACAALAFAAVLGSSATAREPPSDVPLPAREASVAGVTARLEIDNPLRVVRPGEEAKARFVLANSQPAAAKASLEVEIESFDGGKVSRSADLEIPAKGAGEWPIPKDALGALGHKIVRFRLRVGGDASAQAERMFVYLTPTGRPKGDRGPGMLFGLAFGAGPDNFKVESALAADWLGLDVVRLHLPWGVTEPKADQWQWERADEMLRRFEARGLKAEILFSGTADWAVKSGPTLKKARHKGNPGSIPPDPKAWETFAGQFAGHFRGRVAYYEIWNEPDIGYWSGTDDEYLDLLRGAYRAIKAADPHAAVMTAGFAGGEEGGKRNVVLVQRVLKEARDSFDFIAWHRHGAFKSFSKNLEDFLIPLREKTGNARKRFYFTETAMDAKEGLRGQAEMLVKKISYSASLGAEAHTWFNLHDKGSDSHDQFGLLTIDGEPKPDFAAYNTLTAQLRGMTPAPRLVTAPNVWALPFRCGDEWVVVCWREADKAPAELRLETDARAAQTIDIMGNARPLPLASGGVSIPLSSTPVYAHLSGATRLSTK